ncbi:MAG: sigma-54-dependent Fis family transcriptional regulator [Sphingomonadales bacterium]|nr:sigma-54-dependent Fis family transcriptional regulator [Sphingomonadales bacterium]
MELQALKQRFGIIGNAPSLNHALRIAGQVAATDVSVLILGESGVGKEVFSKILHQLSKRKHNKFIAVNCGAIPEGTIDSELFGHEKGSFTGAHESRQGYFETVNGGTIFLDEVAEMPLGTQARLLRVLESGEFIKVGSSKALSTDVRLVAATNVSLLKQIEKGKFREDLYYRMNTVAIQIPSLRERKEDIPLLFRKFAADFSERYHSQPVQLDQSALECLVDQPWPGNIRQLKNVAEQICVLAPTRMLRGEEILPYLPVREASGNLLPVLLEGMGGSSEEWSERDLLYKVLFDLKKDMVEMKRVMGQIMEGEVPLRESDESMGSKISPIINSFTVTTPISRYDEHAELVDIEENLSLMEVEKRLIDKAIRKFAGKRRQAAAELGISERTLYRKIKEYGLEEE